MHLCNWLPLVPLSGVGYQPWIKEDPESTLVRFNPKDPASYKRYVDVLDKFYAKYDNDNNTRVCRGSESNSDIVKDGKVADASDQPCRFDLKPFQAAGCLKNNDYGFKSGTPCVVLSLNRLIGWKPEAYNGDVPSQVARRYKKGSIAFECGGLVGFLLVIICRKYCEPPWAHELISISHVVVVSARARPRGGGQHRLCAARGH